MTKISEITVSATSVLDADLSELESGGTSKKVTESVKKDFYISGVSGGLSIITSSISSVCSGLSTISSGLSQTNYAVSSGLSDTLSSAKSYADGLVVGLFDDRGNYDASGNVYPSTGGSGSAGAILKGDIWLISVAGTLGGIAVSPSDTVRALVDSPAQTSTNWEITQGKLTYVPASQSSLSTVSSGLSTLSSALSDTNSSISSGLSATNSVISVVSSNLSNTNSSVSAVSTGLGLYTTTMLRKVATITSSSGTATIDLASGNQVFKLTLTENTTLAFTNLPAAGYECEIRLELTQNASTAYTLTNPASSNRNAGSVWVNSSVLSSIEDLGLTVNNSGDVTVYQYGLMI